MGKHSRHIWNLYQGKQHPEYGKLINPLYCRYTLGWYRQIRVYEPKSYGLKQDKNRNKKNNDNINA